MNKAAVLFVVVVLLGSVFSVFAEDSGTNNHYSANVKIYTGIGLLGGGLLLSAVSFGQCFLEECGAFEAGFFIGIGMVGVGTTLLIWGIVQRNSGSHESGFLEAQRSSPVEFYYGVAPVKRGAAGQIILRW